MGNESLRKWCCMVNDVEYTCTPQGTTAFGAIPVGMQISCIPGMFENKADLHE